MEVRFGCQYAYMGRSKWSSKSISYVATREAIESGAMASAMGSSWPVLQRRLAGVVPYIVMWICQFNSIRHDCYKLLFLRCYALFCSCGGPTFCCIYEGVLGAAATFDGPIFSLVLGGVLRVFRAVVPRVNSRCLPTLLALFFCVER